MQTPDPSADVGELVQLLEEALTAAKTATEERDKLKAALAEKDRILLEKVASAPPRVTGEQVVQLVDTLIEKGAATRNDREGLIRHLASHPDNLVKLAGNLAQVSIPAPPSGKGIEKDASTSSSSETDPDGWWNVAVRGA